MTDNRFDTAAPDWDKKDGRVVLAGAIADRIARLPLHVGMQAMEYGCGTGLVGLALAPRLGSLVAADSSAGMLETLRAKIAEKGIANVFPRLLDLHQEDCGQDFDLIFSAMTLHHLADVRTILEKFVHSLKPGGILVLADLDEEDGSFHQDNPEGVAHHGFNRRQLVGDLEKLGLSRVQTETVHTIWKKAAAGGEQPFTVFLLIAVKEPM